jgi:hypothetical protein
LTISNGSESLEAILMTTPSFLLDGRLDFFRVIVGLVMLRLFMKPEPSRQFRLRFWVGVLVLVGVAAFGLRPWLSHHALDNWISYGSLFQAIFNLAVCLLLIVRYQLYMPGRVKPETA